MLPLFRDLISGLIVGDTNLDVIEDFNSRDGLEEQLAAISPDLILIGLAKNEADEIGLPLARLLPNAKVIAFSSDGRHAFVHRLRPQRIALLEVSPQMLVDAILAF